MDVYFRFACHPSAGDAEQKLGSLFSEFRSLCEVGVLIGKNVTPQAVLVHLVRRISRLPTHEILFRRCRMLRSCWRRLVQRPYCLMVSLPATAPRCCREQQRRGMQVKAEVVAHESRARQNLNTTLAFRRKQRHWHRWRSKAAQRV